MEEGAEPAILFKSQVKAGYWILNIRHFGLQ